MSYRCQPCGTVIAPGTPMLRHVIKRPDGNIAREVPVCRACKAALDNGAALADLKPPVTNGDDAVHEAEIEVSAPRRAPVKF